MQAFLSHASLEAGETKPTPTRTGVQLMTAPAPRAWEFPLVFLVGMAEGLFLHKMTWRNPAAWEEERCLAYVGVSAMQRLVLTYAETRRLYGIRDLQQVLRPHPSESHPSRPYGTPACLGILYSAAGCRRRPSRLRVPTLFGEGLSSTLRCRVPRPGQELSREQEQWWLATAGSSRWRSAGEGPRRTHVVSWASGHRHGAVRRTPATFAKIGLDRADPDFHTFILTLVIRHPRRHPRGPGQVSGPWKHPAAAGCSWCSGLGHRCPWICYFRALKLGPASLVAPLDKFSVVLVALLGVAFLGERLDLCQWLGVALVTAGVVVLAIRP